MANTLHAIRNSPISWYSVSFPVSCQALGNIVRGSASTNHTPEFHLLLVCEMLWMNLNKNQPVCLHLFSWPDNFPQHTKLSFPRLFQESGQSLQRSKQNTCVKNIMLLLTRYIKKQCIINQYANTNSEPLPQLFHFCLFWFHSARWTFITKRSTRLQHDIIYRMEWQNALWLGSWRECSYVTGCHKLVSDHTIINNLLISIITDWSVCSSSDTVSMQNIVEIIV